MIACILQARISSTRLPGKVLKPLVGKPMLARQIERLKRAQYIDRIVLATSDDPSDDPLETLAAEIGVDCYRGSLSDVLDRYYQAARHFEAEHVIRVTGDCPLIDPQIVDMVIQYYSDGDYDYVSNTLVPTYPDGLDVSIMSFRSLEQAWREAHLPSEREHVTVYIRNHPEIFRTGEVQGSEDHSELRWAVDEPEDFEFITRVYEALYPKNPAFGWQNVLKLLDERPELRAINAHLQRNAGYQKSLQEDQEYLAYIKEKK